jgi:hypothetical protein
VTVPSVRSVSVELGTSTGSSVETTGGGSESTACGCVLEKSP